MSVISSPENTKNEIKVLNANGLQDRQEGYTQKSIAEQLLKESNRYDTDSNQKKELARQYLHAAKTLERLADVVRLKAQQLRNGEISRKEAVRAIKTIVQEHLQMPVPKNATPEMLEKIADELDKKARENRDKADDLVREAQGLHQLSKELKNQSHKIASKELNLSELSLKSALSKSEGLKMVLDKLAVFKLDSQYKQQVAYAQKKAGEELQRR